ncbi:phosphotransacetylase [Amycolatopsis marina]|uniref:Phosphotransacetylase n=1 Tax=Amycolatopsis marina TaxID=490629 RepID=A0A1I0X1W5_9PSEU|nr:phosphotransacetylase [Amycolatopsis marina]SFA94400.1 phosphotransacetylase [Amycolatopsis marina]
MAVSLFEEWTRRLTADGSTRSPRVAFAEGDDPRVRRAAVDLVGHGITPILVSQRQDAKDLPAAVEVTTAATLSAGPAGARVEQVATQRNWSPSAVAARSDDPVYLAAAMVAAGSADACVAGSTRTTGEVIRAGIHVLGLEPATRVLSSSFLMLPVHGPPLAFADCAVVPEPDESQLADIAISTAATFESLTGRTASVAMLSFSTKGSADHESVRRVRAATELARDRAPWLAVDGEIQFDAALVASVGQRKAAGSPVAGQANVFVFPNLAAGNIGYKIAERLGGAQAIGPILQGLNAPMNDLSRGCSAQDVVTVALISALQAQSGPAAPRQGRSGTGLASTRTS